MLIKKTGSTMGLDKKIHFDAKMTEIENIK